MAVLTTLLFKALVAPAAKVLLKCYLQDPALEFGQGTIDFLSDSTAAALSPREQVTIRRAMEDLATEVVDKLAPLFAGESAAHLNVEAVAQAVGATFEDAALVDTMLQENLQPDAVWRVLEQRHADLTRSLTEAERELYHRALRLAVPCVVRLATQLPGFDVAQVRVSLTRLRDLAEDVGAILAAVQPLPEMAEQVQELLEREQAHERQHLSAAQEYERRYRDAVLHHLNTFDLLGIADPEDTQERLELSVAYIPLHLTQRRGRAHEDSDLLSFEALLARLSPTQPGLIIEGPAGSGKTTLLRWAAMQAGRGEESAVAWRARQGWERHERWALEEGSPQQEGRPWRQCVPFFIRLRDCHDGKLPAIEAFPHSLEAGELPEAPPSWVQTLLQERRALVLWDGADEIPPQWRPAMLRAMHGMLQAYPGNYFVLSTRPGVRIRWADDLGLPKADIIPMARPDIAQFVTHWHNAVARVLHSAYPSRAAQLPAESAALLQQLDDEPAVLRLATNPLLCSAICALHFQEKGYLPNKQHQLCEKLCEMLLHDRDRKRFRAEPAPEPYARLDYEQKKHLVQHLAYAMVQSGRSAVREEEATRLVAEQLPKLDGAQAEDGAVVMQTLLERSGLLRSYQANAIEFVHNTLKEYLAAAELCTGLVDPLVQGALGMAGQEEAQAWHNVVVFASALGSESFAADLLQRLLEAPVTPVRERLRQILALRCMAAATRLPEELRQRQRALEREIFPPRTLQEAAALAAAGEQVIRFLRPQRRYKARHLAACVRALRLIGTEAARAALRDYLGYRQKAILDELVQAVHPLEIPVVLEWVQERGRLPEGYRPYIQDVQPLRGQSELQVLDLFRTAVSDVGPLAQLANLHTLWLDRTAVSDVGPLAQLANLQELSLNGTAVSDVGPLAQLANLQELRLTGTAVSDVGPLAQLANLQQLSLTRTAVSDVGPLAQLANLQQLSLDGTGVSDVRLLAQLAHLRWLSLRGTQVRDVGPLAQRPGLQISR